MHELRIASIGNVDSAKSTTISCIANNIIDNGKYIKLDIIEVDVLDGEEMVGYIKTFWLRIIQRKWKKIFKKRKEVIQKRKSLCCLRNREINGKWGNKLNSLY